VRTGRDLDPVEADRWWGRQAVRARVDDPVGTVKLVARRISLLVANSEIGLDHAPGLDRNSWRWTAPVPFCVLLGLAAAGVYLAGFARTGAWPVWSSLLACAAGPLIFYVSSRYRLPCAAVLCLPAGAGVIGLARAARARSRRFWLTLVFLGAVSLVSVSVPTRELAATTEAAALAHRSVAWMEEGRMDAAEGDLRRAVDLDPRSPVVRANLGWLLGQTGREDEALESYRLALAIDPARAEAAAGLASLLLRRDRPDAALPVLRRALESRPDHEACRVNLIVALSMLRRYDEAWSAVEEAHRFGIAVDPELAQSIDRLRRE
jgi:hypothetical protein